MRTWNLRASLARAVRGRQGTFPSLPPREALEITYEVVLRRPADPGGVESWLDAVRDLHWTNQDVATAVMASSEFHRRLLIPGRLLGPSLHSSRCEFVRSLPPARVIVDLGGTDLGNPDGALVAMGYPYPFQSLTIIDLPSEDRHALYQQESTSNQVQTAMGPVTYRYHSMTDLSGFADSSVDLVYSGQSIEHVSPEEGTQVLKEVARILRPGGFLGVDTPNGLVTRLQQVELIDPDHEVEYRLEELTAIIEDAGLVVVDTKGANYAGRSLEAGRFDIDEVAGRTGLYWDAAACYLLCLVAQKPG